MIHLRSRLLIASSLALVFAGAAAAVEVQSEAVPGTFDPAVSALEQEQLAGWLALEENAGPANRPFEIVLTAEESQRLADAPENEGRMLVGINRGVVQSIGREKTTFGEWRHDRDTSVWSAIVRSPGATGLRLHFPGFSLPAGAELYVYSSQGEAFGPYTGKGPADAADLWTNTIAGQELRVQLRVDNSVRGKVELQLSDVVVLGEKFIFGVMSDEANSRAFCSFNASCITNVTCAAPPAAITTARNGIAHLQFVVGGSTYICTGGTLNDTVAATTIPYFLTANHCFSTQAQTNTLEAFFQFSTPCGGACFNPRGSVPRTLGGTLLKTSATSDFTFLRLPSVPAVLATALYRVSHPKGAPQAYSRHSVNTTAGTCGGWPRGPWIYSNDTQGATEGGSSGSPVMNASGQVLGQLSGACGATPAVTCDGDDRTVDGALANYYLQVKPWINP